MLSTGQIMQMKFKVGSRMIQMILEDNPFVSVFGGACRDKILSSYTHQDVHPHNYNLATFSQPEYSQLLDYMQTKFGDVSVGKEKDADSDYPFKVTPIRVNLFSMFLTREMQIEFDIVLILKRDAINCDFDVNSLAYNLKGIFFLQPRSDSLNQLLDCLKAIEAKHATLCYNESKKENQTELENQNDQDLSWRAWELLSNGWKVSSYQCTFGDYQCGNCDECRQLEICSQCLKLFNITVGMRKTDNDVWVRICKFCFNLFADAVPAISL
jgi:hypothetical protein